MRLELKNVGKIKDAAIDLNGITVIAGENNTGKSTVGKMLFCIFHSFYKIEEQINLERQKTIRRVITNYYHERTNRLTRNFNPLNFTDDIIANKDYFLNNRLALVKELSQFYINVDNYFEKYISIDSLVQLADKICDYLNVPDDEIRKIILRNRLDAEFTMKVGYLNTPDEKTIVTLNIKNSDIHFEIVNNIEIVIDRYLSLIKEIVYIDDPFVLDNLNSNPSFRMLNPFGHSGDLLNKIVNKENKNEFSVIDELIGKQKFETIFEAMNDVCDGNLTTDERGTYIYKTNKLNGSLDVANLSTGMKSFIILRKLLENGSIDENGIIILDEPEIHLHPEWQLKFAEIIVLIQKEFGANILLNTHSPYFLNAIEVYSEKYGIEKNCSYYLTIEENDRTNIMDMTQNRERIYEKLARPLQDLENLEYRNGNTIR